MLPGTKCELLRMVMGKIIVFPELDFYGFSLTLQRICNEIFEKSVLTSTDLHGIVVLVMTS